MGSLEPVLAILGAVAVTYVVFYVVFGLIAAWLFVSAMNGKPRKKRRRRHWH